MSKAEVLQRPQLASATTLPELLLEYFESRNLRPSFQLFDERTEFQLDIAGIEPFVVDDLLEMESEDYEKLHKLLIRRKRHSDGYLHRGDAVLCVQTTEAYEQQQELEAHKRKLQHSGEQAKSELVEWMTEMLGHEPIVTGDIPDLPVHVTKQKLDLPLEPE